jgi:hypothetical protein
MNIHAFKCQRKDIFFYLFIWINQSGVKFYARYVNDYSEAKDAFIESFDEVKLNERSGCLIELPLLNKCILNSIEEFTL